MNISKSMNDKPILVPPFEEFNIKIRVDSRGQLECKVDKPIDALILIAYLNAMINAQLSAFLQARQAAMRGQAANPAPKLVD